MQRIFSIIVVSFFMCHFLALGLPTVDLDRNGTIDLQDAIIAIRGLQNLTEIDETRLPGKGTLTIQLGKAFKVFQAIAGQKSLVQPEETKAATPNSLPLTLQQAPILNQTTLVSIIKPHKYLLFQSIDLEQPTPPPQPTC